MRRRISICAIAAAAAQFRFVFSVLLRFISGEFHIDEKRGRSTQTADKNDMKLNDKCVVRIRLYSVV